MHINLLTFMNYFNPGECCQCFPHRSLSNGHHGPPSIEFYGPWWALSWETEEKLSGGQQRTAWKYTVVIDVQHMNIIREAVVVKRTNRIERRS